MTPSQFAKHWHLDPKCLFLNHGSFGACPAPVLAAQQQLRQYMESQPVRFLARELEGLWDAARIELARFVGCDAEGLVFVPNATTGINTVLGSLKLKRGDELLVTDHEYNACRNALVAVAGKWEAKVVTAELPFPANSADDILDAILANVSQRTKLLLVDHVTSQTAMVMPVARLVWEMRKRGVETLVDGAHAPGMLPLDLQALGAAYYTGNCHKWLCAPKGSAFLFVRRDFRETVRPLVVSHGANSPRKDRSRFLLEFGWTGTYDPTPFLCVPEAIRFMAGLKPGGWPEVMRANRELALKARRVLCGALAARPPCPEALIGSMAAVPLPDSDGSGPAPPLFIDQLQDELMARHGIEVPVINWPSHPKRILRVSAQLYNTEEQYAALAAALGEMLAIGD
ncbi:MAG: aminotransferase class V-fold PLP-dependent enzyme [Acidobacteria bacterium]|nr:aminotransferase class V-fold PLP-dependent enzyme [Acidobacteriota bacterium]